MAQLRVTDLTFSYEGTSDTVLENVTFNIDTDWKLGLIGRNGKGKTTLLNLLLGKYEYEGSVITNTCFDYFPYRVSDEDLLKTEKHLSFGKIVILKIKDIDVDSIYDFSQEVLLKDARVITSLK